MTPREPRPERWRDLCDLEQNVTKKRRHRRDYGDAEVRRDERDLLRAELGDLEDD